MTETNRGYPKVYTGELQHISASHPPRPHTIWHGVAAPLLLSMAPLALGSPPPASTPWPLTLVLAFPAGSFGVPGVYEPLKSSPAGATGVEPRIADDVTVVVDG